MPQAASEDPARASGEREDDALGQNLPHQTAAASLRRRAHGELRASRRRSREEEVRKIRAGDEENEADRSRQDPQGPPALADDSLEQSDEVRPQRLVLVGMLDGEAPHRRVQIGARGRGGDAGRERSTLRSMCAPRACAAWG